MCFFLHLDYKSKNKKSKSRKRYLDLIICLFCIKINTLSCCVAPPLLQYVVVANNQNLQCLRGLSC